MRRILVAAVALLASACAYDTPLEPRPMAQAELADALAGRVPGPPLACVNRRDLGGNRSIGDGLILFDGRSRSVAYVNRATTGCDGMNFGRALVLRGSGSQICRGDIANVVDLTTNTHFGGCALGEFIPYRRVR